MYVSKLKVHNQTFIMSRAISSLSNEKLFPFNRSLDNKKCVCVGDPLKNIEWRKSRLSTRQGWQHFLTIEGKKTFSFALFKLKTIKFYHLKLFFIEFCGCFHRLALVAFNIAFANLTLPQVAIMRKSSDETNRLSSSLTFNSFFSYQMLFANSRDREQINWRFREITSIVLSSTSSFLADELLMRKVFRRDFFLIVVCILTYHSVLHLILDG